MKKENKLYIFDFDQTLVEDQGDIWLVKPDGKREIIEREEYYTYKPAEGEWVDFGEFDDVHDPKVYSKIFGHLKEHLSDAVILTARAVSAPVEKYMKSIGMNIPVHAIGVSTVGGDNNAINAKRKAAWIRAAIEENEYSYVEFLDDNPHNIREANKLKKLFPKTKIVTVLIKH